MTIGIDARMLGKGFGLARYVEQLLLQLDLLAHEYTFVLFVRAENKDAFTPTTDRFRIVVADIPWYSAAEQLRFSHIIKKENVDLMHFPHFNVPLLYRAPFVVTIHDLTMYHFPRPEATTRGRIVFKIKDLAHRIIIKSAVRRAKRIITTSEYVRQDVHATLGVPMDKMTTVYQAPFGRVASNPAAGGTPSSPIASVEAEQKTEHKSNLSLRGTEGDAAISSLQTPYLLYVGAAYPHKNIEGLLDAWDIYSSEHEGDETLVLVGKEDYFWKRLQPRIESLDRVTYIGFQTDQQLETLYANARAFVFPSLSEGFGIPPLEALARGTHVLSSSATCLPEVLGSAALYADTTNANMFAERIHTILHDEAVRFDLAYERSIVLGRYSSERFGRETIQIYNI